MFHDKNPTKVANNIKNCGSHVRLHHILAMTPSTLRNTSCLQPVGEGTYNDENSNIVCSLPVYQSLIISEDPRH